MTLSTGSLTTLIHWRDGRPNWLLLKKLKCLTNTVGEGADTRDSEIWEKVQLCVLWIGRIFKTRISGKKYNSLYFGLGEFPKQTRVSCFDISIWRTPPLELDRLVSARSVPEPDWVGEHHKIF